MECVLVSRSTTSILKHQRGDKEREGGAGGKRERGKRGEGG